MPPATLFGFFLRANGIGEKDASAEWHGKTNSRVVKAKARAWVELLLKTGDVSSSSEQAWRLRSQAAAWRRAEAASCATRSPNGSSGRVRARGRARDAVAHRIGGCGRGGGDDGRGQRLAEFRYLVERVCILERRGSETTPPQTLFITATVGALRRLSAAFP